MNGTPLQALPVAPEMSAGKRRALGRLRHLGVLPERGSDSPLIMSKSDKRAARSKKAGSKRMANLDFAEAGEVHGMYSPKDLHRVMGGLKDEVTKLKGQMVTNRMMQSQFIILKDCQVDYEQKAKASEEAKQNYEKKLQQLDAEMNRKLEQKEQAMEHHKQRMDKSMKAEQALDRKLKEQQDQKVKKLEDMCNRDRDDMEKERARNHETFMSDMAACKDVRETNATIERSLERAKAVLDGKDTTKLQDKVRELERENAKLEAKLQRKKKRKRSHADQHHRRQLETITNTASTANT